ncbi:MAG: hypothetical protein AAFY20_25750 [Cyanobacteria bacterium J06639_14]
MIAIAPIKSLPDGSVDSSQFFPDVDVPTLYQQVVAAIANGASPPRAIRSVI